METVGVEAVGVRIQTTMKLAMPTLLGSEVAAEPFPEAAAVAAAEAAAAEILGAGFEASIMATNCHMNKQNMSQGVDREHTEVFSTCLAEYGIVGGRQW